MVQKKMAMAFAVAMLLAPVEAVQVGAKVESKQKSATKTNDKDPKKIQPKTDNEQSKLPKHIQLFDQNNDLKIWKNDQYPLGFNQLMYYELILC